MMTQTHEDVRAIKVAEENENLGERIIAIHSEVETLVSSAQDHARAAILKARECGVLLLKAKADVGKGKWTAWHSAHVRNSMSYDTADRYMKLASMPEEFLQGALSLRQAYIQSGILPESHRANPGAPGERIDGWISAVQRAWEKVNIQIEQKKVDDWNEIERQTFLTNLAPLVKVYVQIGGTV